MRAPLAAMSEMTVPGSARKAFYVVLFVLIWQAICSFGLVSPIILASPLSIVLAVKTSGLDYLSAIPFTLFEIVVGIGAAWILGVGAGLLIGTSRLLSVAIAPILSAIFAVPLIVWYPIMLIWFGLGAESKIVFGAAAGFFPIALNTITAAQSYDRNFMTLGRSLGASGLQLYWKFVLPLLLSPIIASLRIGTSFVVIGILVSEMIASTDGIGFWISTNRTMFKTGDVYLGILLALGACMLVNWLLTVLERRAGAWRDAELLSSGR